MMTDFDSRAKEWDTDPMKVERAHVIAEAITARVPLAPGMSALEYGCGTGLLSFALQPHLSRITLADSSEGMLSVLREKIASSGIRNMTPIRLDLLTDPLPNERYDLLYTMMTLHHVPDTAHILQSLHSLLDPGGFLCVADLEKEDGSFHGPEFSGHKGFDRNELAAKASRAGFEQIEFSTVYNLIKKVDGKNQGFPVFLMVARKP